MMRTGTFILVWLLAGAITAGAQVHGAHADTVLKGATIEVLQAYKPEVRQAPKPEWIPQLPPPDTIHAPVSYTDIPRQSLFYSYNALPLHPLELANRADQLPFANYVDLGAGNLNTLYLDAGIGSLKGADYETDFHVHHLSQKGDIQNQQTSLDGLEANGALHTQANDWHVGLEASRDQYHYYGYDHSLYNLSSDTTRQTYVTLAAHADVQNKDSAASIGYHPAVGVSSFTSDPKTSETSVNYNLPFWYRFGDGVQARLSVFGAFTSYNGAYLGNSWSGNNNYGVLQPGFSYEGQEFQGHALLGLASDRYSQYLLPDINAAYRPEDTKLVLMAGIQYQLVQNTYRQLATENPYIIPMSVEAPSEVGQYYGGVKGGIGDHFSLYGKVSYWYYEHLATFENGGVYWLSDPSRITVWMDNDVNAFSIEAGGRYAVADKWSAGLSESFYNFSGGSSPYAWGIPTTQIRGDVRVQAGPKLSLAGYLAFMGGIWALDNGVRSQLPSYTDIGCSGEFVIVPHIAVFARISNLLNDHYERWYGYQAYGLNVYGGLELRF